MAFAEPQLRLLAGKLAEKHVKTREQHGLTLSYVEAWHAIAEANRIFGFDGWDRETLFAECIWQDGRGATKACAYAARVRIRVRAGETIVQRDGSGAGQGTGSTLGEAHESALKEAETDATKRALVTFGNLFGLALYDREQVGVKRAPKPREPATPEEATRWCLFGSVGDVISYHDTADAFCTALREAIDRTVLPQNLISIWRHNEPLVERMRNTEPALKTGKGEHYADVLCRYLQRAQQRMEAPPMPASPEPVARDPIDKSALVLANPKRLRDPEHRRFVGNAALSRLRTRAGASVPSALHAAPFHGTKGKR